MDHAKEKAKLIKQIEEMAKDCSAPNWDGYGAFPIGSQAVENSKIFVQTIPDIIEIPECSPSPDGAISLEWIFDRGIILSVSVSHSDILAYAWLNNDEKGHGTVKFDGKQTPEEIVKRVLILQATIK